MWVRFTPAAQGCVKVHTRRNHHSEQHHFHHTPQGFSFQWTAEAPSQPCWQTLSCAGEESMHFAASQAKLSLQPPGGCISNSCQLLLLMFTIIWDYTLHNLSCLLHMLHFPALPSSQQGDISDFTGDSSSASPEITTHNSTVLDLKPEQHTGQNHT